MEPIELLILWSGISFFTAIACGADGLDSYENKPSTWLLILFCIPGVVIWIGIGLFICVLISPFWLIDKAWKKYNDKT